jgi:hypothetical protein
LTENSEIVEDAAIIAYEYVAGPLTVKTHEWFGSGGGSAGRPILMSQRVKHIPWRMCLLLTMHRAYEMERAHFSAAKIINE